MRGSARTSGVRSSPQTGTHVPTPMTLRTRSLARTALTALAITTVATTPHALAAQSFEGVITVNVSLGGKKPAVQVISVKGSRWRMDSDMGGMAEKGAILADGEGHVTMLVAARKMYMRPPMMQVKGNEALADFSFTPTGKKDRVLEYDCEYYDVHNASSPKEKNQWCISSALGVVGFSPMRELSNGSFLRKTFPKGFFTLKGVDEKGRVVYEVVKVERRKLDDALFAPPADYTELKMPAFGDRKRK